MSGPFEITASTSTVTLDSKRQATIVFTVRNTTKMRIPSTARLIVEPIESAEWYALSPQPPSATVTDDGWSRSYEPEETQRYTIQITVPEGAAPGEYRARLVVADKADPDDRFTESSTIRFSFAPAPAPPPRAPAFPLWLIPLILVILAVVVGGTFILGRATAPAEPTATATSTATATATALPTEAASATAAATNTQPPTATSVPPTPNAPPTAAIAFSVTGGMAPLSVEFRSDSSGSISSYAWSFGDGGTSDSPTAEHTYFAPGIYNVSLQVSNDGGSDSAELPIVVAPRTSAPLYLEVWLTEADLTQFGPFVQDWTRSFPDGSEVAFRTFETSLLIDYLEGETPIAMGEPDVLFLSWVTHTRLDELFGRGYVLFDPASGDQPSGLVIWSLTNLARELDAFQVAYQLDTTAFATNNNVVYGVPFGDGYLAPIATQRMGNDVQQALAFSLWLHMAR